MREVDGRGVDIRLGVRVVEVVSSSDSIRLSVRQAKWIME